MDATIQSLAVSLVEKLAHIPLTERYIVGISGSPASGKSTIAQLVVDAVNTALAENSPSRAALVGLDGWHLTRAQLDAFPDPKLAHDRRGAHWTFDGANYVAFVRSLRTFDDKVVHAPSFDHALKDPTPDAVAVHPHHRIVVIEGLYTFLSIEPWNAASALLDERWWIEVGEEDARERLIKRHVISGVARDEEEARWRAEENDLPNGRFIREHMMEPTKILHSVHDPVLA